MSEYYYLDLKNGNEEGELIEKLKVTKTPLELLSYIRHFKEINKVKELYEEIML